MAVYTHINQEDIQPMMADLGLPPVSALVPVADGVTNTNYIVQTAEQQYILTLFEAKTDISNLPYFVQLMDQLADRQIPCPRPLKNAEGKAVFQICGRSAIMVSFLSGQWLRQWDVSDCQQVGRVLAQFHLAGADLSIYRPNDLALAGWKKLYQKIADQADQLYPGLSGILSAELNWLEQQWPQDLPSGVIHADLFPDNVLFSDRMLTGVIDWYFACYDSWAYDLAIALNAWCFDSNGQWVADKAHAMLQGYQDVRPLQCNEQRLLPVLARCAAMRFLLMRSHDKIFADPKALVTPKDPIDFLRRLTFFQSWHHGVEE